MKTYHFLAGLPRSGNTLLSSILNQNPKIYSSPLSPITSIMWDLNTSIHNTENAQIYNKPNDFYFMVKNIIPNYYENIEKEIIIDREKAWATPFNLSIIKNYVNPTPKIIFTVRPVIEILTSFINILPNHSYIDIEMEELNWWSKDYLTKNDNRCDYLMRPFGQIDKILYSLNEVLKPENKNIFHVISYDDIVNEPEQTMTNIYQFLELPYYKHNFNNVINEEKENIKIAGSPKDLHKIRPIVKKVSKDPKEVLSEYVINKYSNIGYDLG